MPDNKAKVSLYFPKDLFKKFEGLRSEKEDLLGVTISKNEFALKLISDALGTLENKGMLCINEMKSEYSPSEKDIRAIRRDLESLRAEVDKLRVGKSSLEDDDYGNFNKF